MIPQHLEPQGLAFDVEPIADWQSAGDRRADAVRGSNKLLDAILRAARVPAPVFKAVPTERPGRPRKRGRKRPKRLARALRVIELVAEHAQLTADELTAKDRHRSSAHPRQVAMYLIRLTTGTSYPGIGKYFGGKDHTTVMHGIRAVQGRIATNDEATISAMRFVHERLRG